jgi:hypothetical protein
MNWYENYEDILSLCEWLDSECVLFTDATAAIAMLQNPTKWQREYAAWRLWLEIPTKCKQSQEMVVVAVIGGDEINQEFSEKVRRKYKSEKSGGRHHSFPRSLFNLVFGCVEPEESGNE